MVITAPDMFVNFYTDDSALLLRTTTRGKMQRMQCGHLGIPFAKEQNCFVTVTHCKTTHLVQLVITVAVTNNL